MKWIALYHVYLTGFLLSGVSAIVAIVLSSNNYKKSTVQNGILQASNGVSGAQLTCTNGNEGNECTDTQTYLGDCNGGGSNNGIGSRTSREGASTSLITTALGIGCVSTLTSSPRLIGTSAQITLEESYWALYQSNRLFKDDNETRSRTCIEEIHKQYDNHFGNGCVNTKTISIGAGHAQNPEICRVLFESVK